LKFCGADHERVFLSEQFRAQFPILSAFAHSETRDLAHTSRNALQFSKNTPVYNQQHCM